MEIRFLTSDDANEWWRLRLEALQGDPEAFSSSAEEHQSLSLEDVRSRLGSPTGDSFVVGSFDEGRLVGMVGFYREKGLKTRHKGRIWGVYVTPSHRVKGLARLIMDRVLDRAQSIDGIEQILLSYTTTQAAAKRLYVSLGFEPFGREPRALKVFGNFIDEEYMVLLKRAVRDGAGIQRS
jgi:ribosomal protein S18 acetylase RimI-like enzyme